MNSQLTDIQRGWLLIFLNQELPHRSFLQQMGVQTPLATSNIRQSPAPYSVTACMIACITMLLQVTAALSHLGEHTHTIEWLAHQEVYSSMPKKWLSKETRQSRREELSHPEPVYRLQCIKLDNCNKVSNKSPWPNTLPRTTPCHPTKSNEKAYLVMLLPALVSLILEPCLCQQMCTGSERLSLPLQLTIPQTVEWLDDIYSRTRPL